MSPSELSERERQVLEAVIRSYVETAEPAGSRALTRRFRLGVSPATIRNTMADLEEKGFLSHPHTSAGRVPTDKAYRVYVDSLMHVPELALIDRERLMGGIVSSGGSAIETILRRTAQSLGVLTQELGVALGPRLDQIMLQRLELVRVTSEKLLLVLTLQGGTVRTVFIEVRGEMADTVLAEVQLVLNERLAGMSLSDIRLSLGMRLRDVHTSAEGGELLNIFVQEGNALFDLPTSAEESVVLGQASVLADKPEFASGDAMRKLIALTDTGNQLASMLRQRASTGGMSITIGAEHDSALLGGLTVVTAEYRAGALTGVIGVIGPTRMPYEKVIAVVRHASQLVQDVLA
jgi:heat-inducible transcriptional repressor